MFGKKKFYEKKKILIYTPYYFPEPFPINSFVDELCDREEVDKITVITSLPNYRNYGFYDGYSIFGPYKENTDKLEIIRLPVIPRFSNSKKAIFLFYLSFFLSSIVFIFFYCLAKRNKFNHILTFCGSPVYVGYIGYIASKILNSKSSLWIQDIWPEAIETTIGMRSKPLRSIIYKFQNLMWKFCDIIFSESKALSNYLEKRDLNKRIVTLYNPVRNESIATELSLKKINTKNSFSYIGNIGGAQNIELLLRSFKNANLKNSKLNICGDGGLFSELSKKYNNSDILWHGWIEGDNLEKIYQESDFFILSLNSVGRQSLILPSKVQSYFMYRRPILCISTGASKDLIRDCKAGYFCESISEEDIINMFNKAENSSTKERDMMAENGFKFYNENFKKEKIVDKFLKSI